MTRRLSWRALAVLALVAVAGVAGAQGYPNRPITLLVPWAAGGGTDFTARAVAPLLEKELGVPVNVVNRTGGSGVVGHKAMADAPADGYTLGMATIELAMMHWSGLTDLTYRSLAPLCRIFVSPAGVHVRADAPYRSVGELLAAIRANPGRLKASGTGQGGIWHIALAGMLRANGIEASAVPWVPSQGAAPALQDLAAGAIDFVTVAPPEARALAEAGKVRSLAVMYPTRLAALPQLPTMKEAGSADYSLYAWGGIVAPRGLPKDVEARLVAALRKVYESKPLADAIAGKGFVYDPYITPAAFGDLIARTDAEMGAVMRAVGLARP